MLYNSIGTTVGVDDERFDIIYSISGTKYKP